MSAMKPKHQRLTLIVIALIALIGAGLLAAYALRNQASYFYVPSQMTATPPEADRAVRLGGMVRKGSVAIAADGITLNFVVEDGEASVPVRYAGIVPDLFVEGSGVVAEGKLGTDGVFVADNLLAKHDENYVPRELREMDQNQAAQTVAETTQ